MTRRKVIIAAAIVAAVCALMVFAFTIAGLLRHGARPAEHRADTSALTVPAARSGQGDWRVDYGRLQQRIGVLMQDPDMVGLAVGTIEGGRVSFVQGFGETAAGSGVKVTPTTVFRWASLSKGVASALVTQLSAEGKVPLDRRLSDLGTTLTLPGGTQNVTVADLLSHRTGLVRNAWDDRLEGGADPRALRAGLHTLPPYCPPATCYTYQNVAYDTASEIVERATGLPYAQAARTRLFAPLGMSEASVGRDGLMTAARWAQPHRRGRKLVAVADPYYRVPAAGGVNSSIFDLLRWMRAQLGDAPGVLPPALLQEMHRPRVPTPPHGRRGPMDLALTDASYGLGWRSFHYNGHTLVGHRGAVDGYGSLILFDPALKSGIVMLWNANTGRPARLQLEFFDMLYGLPATDWLGPIAQPEAAPGAAAAIPH